MRSQVCSLAGRLSRSVGSLSGEATCLPAWLQADKLGFSERGFASSPDSLKKTPLYDFHVKNGGEETRTGNVVHDIRFVGSFWG